MTARRPARVSPPALLGAVVVFAAGAAGGYLARPFLTRPTTKEQPTSAAPAPETISALARLRPLGGTIPVYGPPGDRIAELSPADVFPGRNLKVGDKIATLASRSERLKEMQVGEAQLAEAERQVELVKKSGGLKIAAAEVEAKQVTADEELDRKSLNSQVAVLEENQRFAAAQVNRLKSARVSAEEKEQVDLLLSKANAELEAGKAKRDKATAGYTRAKELADAKLAAARAELDESVARAGIDSARKKVELAKQLLELTVIKAPINGQVLKVASHAGEPTGVQQPILYMANTAEMVAVAEVYESDVTRLRESLAQGRTYRATVTSPALPRGVELTGTVTEDEQVTRMIARNAIYAVSPREDADRRVVEVYVKLDAESAKRAAPYVGLQVQVVLDPGGKR